MPPTAASNVQGVPAGWHHEVVVAGAGPSGLMLAAELALAGVDVVIVERRLDQHLDGSRAGGLLSRSLEVLDQRGVVERFLAAGHTVPMHGFGAIPLDVSDLPTRHNYVLALPQREFEPILADWVLGDLGVPIRRGTEVVSVIQDDEGVEVGLGAGRSLRARYLVGCDGGRSAVRNAARVRFIGSDPTTSWLIAEVDLRDEPQPGSRYDEAGLHGLSRVGEDGPAKVVLTERTLRSGKPTVDELRDALVAVYGTDYGLHRVHWISRFTDVTRIAVAYRDRRVILAGDAAHIHPPHGGQGLNTGLQDAVNLGWKLADVIRGRAPDELLDTYHHERYPAAARVLENTLSQVVLTSGGDHHHALRSTVADLLSVDATRTKTVAMLCGLDVHYDLVPNAHPLVGRRMPDLALDTHPRPTSIFRLLREARPVLVNFGAAGTFEHLSELHQIRSIDAAHPGAVRLPLLGPVEPPPAVLIRPDGHVAWTGDPSDPGLPHALAHGAGSTALASLDPDSFLPTPASETAQETLR